MMGPCLWQPADLTGRNAIETYCPSLYPLVVVYHPPSPDCHLFHLHWVQFQRQTPLLQLTPKTNHLLLEIYSVLYVDILGRNYHPLIPKIMLP